ncbi:flagellar biosynthesis anti-sigma factor FlgM [Variovorax ginsengisoli]|uniref:Negative regulator of flagellin synthesis n=1 Tax=Variovorax ginsengisoli TaxID=363844 RepID=A0ABT9SD35_9BURK|nr:flagellar biosynthesis anti-sigma factor FlgM [Variovorax ginsengisoli]MDP9902271.1 negative regulator of flagellin synthesis FlgM [Variovorax ginsengisoli]
MKIDPPAAPAIPLSRSAKTPSAASSGIVANAAEATPAPSGQVHQLQAVLGGDFDAARVAAIREDIRAGRYEVRPERIADGLLASVHELLNPPKGE